MNLDELKTEVVKEITEEQKRKLIDQIKKELKEPKPKKEYHPALLILFPTSLLLFGLTVAWGKEGFGFGSLVVGSFYSIVTMWVINEKIEDRKEKRRRGY